MVTQRSIAERAGVSRAAVSIVLGDPETKRVSAAVKEQILTACAELGYSGDARGRRRRLCITVDPKYGALEPYFSRFMAGAGPCAEAAGYALVVKELSPSAKAASFLVNLNCDGIIAYGALRLAMARKLNSALPLVALNQPDLEGACDQVGFDDVAGVSLLTQQLIDHGHRRIAYVATGACTPSTDGARPAMLNPRLARRVGAYLGTMVTRGLPIDEAVVLTEAKTAELGLRSEYFIEDALDHLLALNNPPTAIVAYNDIIAESLLGHMRARSLHVPQDLSLVGFDATATMTEPALTTVDPGLAEVGRQAVACVLARIAGGPVREPQNTVATPKLIMGETMADPAATRAVRSKR
ncbi:MAG: LacI family DNA-binding transcriptional regulator [Planctomycetota bacterium]|nr:LacI family DNA-binding transcriptional regulator [Planctomycetota bacterium]